MVDKFKKNHLLLNGLAVAIAFYSGHGVAAEGGEKLMLEEVVVTSQKRSESLQDVPIAVSAFDGDALKDYGVSSLKALQAVTPNLVMNNTGAISQPYLRGIGTTYANMGLEPSIATYIDDRYISRSTATLFELADVERIEVLKGPQGTLYGRNAAGGAIRVITKAPADEFEGTITADVGNYSHRGVTGTVSVPLSETISTRFSGIIKRRDGYVDNLSPEGVSSVDDQDFQAYRAKLQWDMTDQSSMMWSVAYLDQDDNNGGGYVVLPPYDKNTGIDRGGITGTAPDEIATALDSTFQNTEMSSQLRFDFGLEKFDFATVTTYSNWDSDRNIDGDATSAVVLDVPSIVEQAETFTQEFQVFSNGDGDWDSIAGLYFFKQEGITSMLVDVGASRLVSLGQQSVETDAWSLFGQTTWHIDKQWSLTLGARWNEEKKKLELSGDSDSYILSGSIRNLVPFEDSESWTEFTPKVTLDYAFGAGMTYFTYSRGFKSGGFNYPAANGEPLDSEVLDMYELGLKADLFDDRLRFNAALFYYDYQDLQVSRAGAGAGGEITLTTENAANATVLGFESDITWLVNQQLTINAGIGLLDSEYQDYDASAKVFSSTAAGSVNAIYDADGKPMLRAPDTSVYLSAKYEFGLDGATIPVVLTYSYKSDYDFDFIASEETEALGQDAYGLLNARVSYQPHDQPWSLSLWSNNLTDEEYFNDVALNSAGIRGSYGAPQTFGVDVTYDF